VRQRDGNKLGGPDVAFEVDESFVGCKAKNIHRSRADKIRAAIP